MTTKKNLVKTMFMNILTAGVFTVAFTACSDDIIDSNANDNGASIVANDNEKLLEPLGLVYTDFINDNDVTIQNSDTTEISVSKAYADKMGISNFVSHPMGIWDKKDNTSYLCRATEQRLEGDRYILKVKRSTIAEITGGRDMVLSTALYYNPSAASTRAAATGMSEDAAKYVDENNVIHPAAITINSLPGENTATRGAVTNYGTYTVEEIFNGQIGADTRWWNPFSWAADKVKKVAKKVQEATTYNIDADKQTMSLLNEKMKLEKNWKVECGPGEEDTLNIDVDCPIEYAIDYTLEVHAKGDISTLMIPKLKYLETYFDGYFGMNPKVTLGFSKDISLPKDKQRIKLYNFTGLGATFFIGYVPVHIDFDPSIYLKLTASLEGKAYVGLDYQFGANVRAGVKYNNGNWSGIFNGGINKNDFDFISPTVELEAKAGVGLMLGVDVIINKIAGPTLNLGPQLNAKANLTIAPWAKEKYELTAKVTAGCAGEVGAKVKVFGYELADWKWPFEVGPQKTIYQYPAADK